jgi:phosphohistidine phosphatase
MIILLPAFGILGLLFLLRKFLAPFMKVWVIVRHAKSSWSNPKLEDIERPLNKRGKRDAPFMAKLLHGKSFSPDLLLTSPALRALTTAEHFAKQWKLDDEKLQIKEEIYEAYPEDLIRMARKFPDNLDTVFLFGHNPTITDIANRYTEDYIENVPTCGIIVLQADIEKWKDLNISNTRLQAFFYPKQFFN